MTDQTLDAGMPCNTQAEQTILGAIMLENQAFYEAQESGIEAQDFFLDSHQRTWSAMCSLMDAQKPVDLVTLAHELRGTKELASVGGVSFIAALTEGLPRRPVIAEYLRIVRDKSLARRLMQIAGAVQDRAADGGTPAQDLAGEMSDAVLEASSRVSSHGRQIDAIVVEDAMRFEAQADAPFTGILGASLFTPELSRITAGLQDNELCLICARPGQGKTEAAIQIAVENARNGLRVHFQSMEMKSWQLVRRMLRYMARIPVSHMRDPRCLRPEERQAIRNAREELLDLPIFIDDTHELTCSDYRSRAVLATKRWKADLILVDYAQLLIVPTAKGDAIKAAPKQAETLRHIARDYCRTIALAQLRRSPPNDLNLYPDIEMIFGASQFEQAAQMILLLHRERKEKRYTGEDFCFIGKMRELQGIEPIGIKANPWGGFVDRYESGSSSTWHDKED